MPLSTSKTDSLLQDIRDSLRKLVKVQEDICKTEKNMVSDQLLGQVPVSMDKGFLVPVSLDWSELYSIMGAARITDDGTLVSIRIMLDPEESAKARETMNISPVDSLVVTSMIVR